PERLLPVSNDQRLVSPFSARGMPGPLAVYFRIGAAHVSIATRGPGESSRSSRESGDVGQSQAPVRPGYGERSAAAHDQRYDRLRLLSRRQQDQSEPGLSHPEYRNPLGDGA